MTAHILGVLTAKGKLPNGEGFGGISSLTPSDVSGALGIPANGKPLSKAAYLLGLSKYCLDGKALLALHKSLAGEFGRRKYPIPSTLALIAVVEAIDDGRCPACHGTGEPYGKTCEHCGGAGTIPTSIRGRARLAGVPKSTWFRKYEPTYCEAARYIQDAEIELQSHLDWHFGRY